MCKRRMATSVRRENLLVNGNDINIFCRREMIHAPRDLSFELCRLKYYFKFIRLALNSSVCHEPVRISYSSAALPNATQRMKQRIKAPFSGIVISTEARERPMMDRGLGAGEGKIRLLASRDQ